MSKAGFQRCVELISSATGLLVTAGAGMGVDSGLPDFRGNDGLWNHYPALGKQGMSFADIASPATFYENPKLAWGFYGHRLNLYREAIPHQGFEVLREIGSKNAGRHVCIHQQCGRSVSESGVNLRSSRLPLFPAEMRYMGFIYCRCVF